MTCRECRAGAALADAQRVINRPKAKKERIAFIPMNRANGPGWDEPGPFLQAAGGGCKLPAVDHVRSVGHGPKISQGIAGTNALANGLRHVFERSVAAIDTAMQVATRHCPAQTRQPDRRGSPDAATSTGGRAP